MGKAFLCLIFSCCFGTFAQDDGTEVKVLKNHFKIYVNPTLNYRLLKASSGNNLVKSLRDTEEVIGFGYSAGFSYLRTLSSRFTIETGFAYSNRVYKTQIQSLEWTDSQVTTLTETYRSRQFLYFDIPLRLTYKLAYVPRHKMTWFIAGGGVVSFNITNYERNHVKVENTWQMDRDIAPNLSHTIFMIDAGVGMYYQIKPQIRLQTSAYFQQAVTPINRDLPTKEHLNGTGLMIGIVFTPVFE